MKEGMLFPLNVVDGLVHELGGFQLAIHCLLLPKKDRSSSLLLMSEEEGDDDSTTATTTVRCPVGCAVSTPPGGKRLAMEYDRIVHTVPPFYEHPNGQEEEEEEDDDPNLALLSNCYRNSLRLCEQFTQQDSSNSTSSSSLRIACPLLGAGGRGFPLQEAVMVAAKESLRWRKGYKRCQ